MVVQRVLIALLVTHLRTKELLHHQLLRVHVMQDIMIVEVLYVHVLYVFYIKKHVIIHASPAVEA